MIRALILALSLSATPALADTQISIWAIAGQIVAKEVCGLPYLRETLAASVRDLQNAGYTPEQIMEAADNIATMQGNRLIADGQMGAFCAGMERTHTWAR